MWSRIVALVVATGLVSIALVSTSYDQPALRRRLQHVVPQQPMWASGGGGFQSVGQQQPQNMGGFAESASGGSGGPPEGWGSPPQHQQDGRFVGQAGFGGSPPTEQGGFGGISLPQQEQGFGVPPPHQQQGFDSPPPQQQQQPGFESQLQDLGGPLLPPQQSGFGSPPAQQGQGFGAPLLPAQQGQGFGAPLLPAQQGQGFGAPLLPPQQGQGFGAPLLPPQQEQVSGGTPPQQVGRDVPPPQMIEKKARVPPQAPPQQQGSGECQLRDPQEVKVEPTWTASFPGSGGKLLWQTIEQLTGIASADDNDSNGRLRKGTCVTVKTHYPSRHVSPKFFIMDTSYVKHAILMVRNPLDVMPSYFKFLYRTEEDGDPNDEPPVDRWVVWRNDNFKEQLDKWVEHTDWWMKNYQASGKLMILPFEHFTDPKVGPETLKALGIFLGRTDPMITPTLTPDSNLGCLWNMMIGDTAPAGSRKKGKTKPESGQHARYPYTLANLASAVDALKGLKATYAGVPQLSNMLAEYLKKVTVAKRKVEQLLAA